jgi:hypothetical protein
VIATTASAYTLTLTADQHPVRLRYGQKLFVAGNPGRPGGFPAPFFEKAIVSALSQWKWATQGVFDFEYWQGTDKKVYEPNLSRNGESSIFFASNSNEPTDPNVIGYTQVWYNSSTGDIVEADVLLNDRNYELTTSEKDTSSQGGGMGFGGKPRVYLGNIITHELGHALGLSHSGHLNASMLYVEYSEQSKIGCDDYAGARHLYPSRNAGQGTLTGTVLGPSGAPVSGVSVTALSQARGIPIATIVTDQAGEFTFGAIETGAVALMLEKFPGAGSTIPARVQARANQPVCNGVQYPTQFVSLADGHQLREFEVVPGQTVNTGAIRLQCQTVQTARGPVTASESHFIVDQAQSGSHSYRFRANGPFSVAGIGHLLLSPVKVSLQAYDERGRMIATQIQSPIYRGNSNYQIEDSILRGSATGWVEIRAVPSAIPSSRFPTPALWPNPTPLYVLSFNSEANRTPASEMPTNARCTPPDELPAYKSPPGLPIRNYADRTSRDSMGCGRAEAATFDGHPVTDPGNILGRMLPFLLLGLVQLFFWFRARRLKE